VLALQSQVRFSETPNGADSFSKDFAPFPLDRNWPDASELPQGPLQCVYELHYHVSISLEAVSNVDRHSFPVGINSKEVSR
jgi:hypothetical protein